MLLLSFPFLWDRIPSHWVIKWLPQSRGQVIFSSSGFEKSQRSVVISRRNGYLTHAATKTQNLAMLCRCIDVPFISETSGPIPIKFPYCECTKTWWHLILLTSETKHIVFRTIYLFFSELCRLHFNIIFFFKFLCPMSHIPLPKVKSCLSHTRRPTYRAVRPRQIVSLIIRFCVEASAYQVLWVLAAADVHDVTYRHM